MCIQPAGCHANELLLWCLFFWWGTASTKARRFVCAWLSRSVRNRASNSRPVAQLYILFIIFIIASSPVDKQCISDSSIQKYSCVNYASKMAVTQRPVINSSEPTSGRMLRYCRYRRNQQTTYIWSLVSIQYVIVILRRSSYEVSKIVATQPDISEDWKRAVVPTVFFCVGRDMSSRVIDWSLHVCEQPKEIGACTRCGKIK